MELNSGMIIQESAIKQIMELVDERVARLLAGQMLKANVDNEASGKRTAKLFDGSVYLSTITFIKPNIGITTFHSVYVPSEKHILESTLHVQLQITTVKVKHVVSFPHFDLAVYCIEECVADFFDIGFDGIHLGDPVTFVFFPALDDGDCNPSEPIFSHGRVVQTQPSDVNNFIAADYNCFPGNSGGAVISQGKLIGMHVAMIYYKDNAYQTLVWESADFPPECGAVYSLFWDFDAVQQSIASEESTGEQETLASNDAGSSNHVDECGVALSDLMLGIQSIQSNARFAAANCFHKAHLAFFLPAPVIFGLFASTRALDGVALCKRKRKRRH